MGGDGEGDGEGEGLGEGLGLGDGDGVGQAPARNGSCESAGHDMTPDGGAYQSRMLVGSGLMNRLMIVSPTFSPNA